MSTKRLQKSLDTVRSDVRELTEAFWALRDDMRTQQAVSAAENQSRAAMNDRAGEPSATAALAEITSSCDGEGYVSAFGYYETTDDEGTRHIHRWAMEDRPVEDVLAIQAEEAAKVLAAIGHRQRLGIVLLLLDQPSTASEIVQRLPLGTTGAAYHHLNVLQGVGLVQQEQRSVFSLVPERVPSVLLVLSGVSNSIETRVETVAQEDQTEDTATPGKKKKKDA
jgi:DNA gyrase subunit B